MPEIILPRLTSGYASVEAINTALEQLENAINEALSREGDIPNQMNANLDMNSKRILNIPPAVNPNEPVTLGQLRNMSTVVLYEPNPHTHPWAQITDKPATYPPSTHQHEISQVVGLSTQLTNLSNRLTDIEERPVVYVQSSEPTAENVNDLWIF